MASDICQQAANIALHLAPLGALFLLIETLAPAVPGQRKWRAGSGTDLALTFLNPILVAPVAAALLEPVLNGFIEAVGAHRYEDAQRAVGAQPLWLQVLAALIVADFASYWKHRLFHSRPLWPIHAVHHSATEVDWLTNNRDHPAQVLGTTLFHTATLVLCGFGPGVVAIEAIIRVAYSFYSHANVSWSHCRLERILVSPAFHRWHHSVDPRGAHKNFAVIFSLLDVVFGTYLDPIAHGRPSGFGLGDREMPKNLLSVVWHPFEHWLHPSGRRVGARAPEGF